MAAVNSGIARAGTTQNLDAIGKILVKDIKKRTRKGKEIKELGDTETDFKELATSTISRRKRSKLSKFTSPSKSNQTNKNKMVASLSSSSKPFKLTLFVDKKQEIKLQNNRKLGRNFLQLSEKNLKTIVRRIGSFISETIERGIN